MCPVFTVALDIAPERPKRYNWLISYFISSAAASNDENNVAPQLPRFPYLDGAYRDRTCDLLVANQALSQLS